MASVEKIVERDAGVSGAGQGFVTIPPGRRGL
jgi:hypothetical protein